MSARMLTKSLALAASVCAAATIIAPAAHAAPASAPAQVTYTISKPMRQIGFNPEIARAHGYSFSKDSQGVWHTFKEGGKGEMKPQNTTTGDCGSAYVTVAATGSGDQANLDTGYTSKLPSISYNWAVKVVDNYGTSHQKWGGNFFPPTSTWHGHRLITSGGPNWVYVQVDNSWVWLADGEECGAFNPSDSTYVHM